MPFDPNDILRQLKAERKNMEAELKELDGAIAYFERRAEAREEPPKAATGAKTARKPKSNSDGPAVIPEPDAFVGMSNPDAVKEYLRMAGKPQTPRQIVDALKMGGTESEAEKFYSTIYTTLRRLKGSGVRQSGDGEWEIAPDDELPL